MPLDSFKDSFIANTVVKWKETYELSFELADVTFTVLNEIVDYCKKHDIPISKDRGLWNLVLKARSIFKEIENLNSPTFEAKKLLPDDFSQKRLPDGDYTEP